jgi:hypothetical protein
MIGEIWACSLLVVTLTTFIVGGAINERMKINHPDAWERLGRPSFWNNSPANSMRSTKFFILSRQYKLLNDPILDRYVLGGRLLTLTGISLLLVGFLLMFSGKLG